MHKRIVILIATLAVAALGLTSCGGGTNGEADAQVLTTSAPTTTVPHAKGPSAGDRSLTATANAAAVDLWIRTANANEWYRVAAENAARDEAARVEAARAEANRQAQRRRATTTAPRRPSSSAPAPQQRSAPSQPQASGSNCGGNLPPCYVVARESGNNPTAKNPRSTASGTFQFLDGTWGNYKGYRHASDAPQSVQNERAAQVWNGGKGCSAWSAC